MKFKLGKSKITNFVCHKNFQGKKTNWKFWQNTGKFYKQKWNLHWEKKKIPIFFSQKFLGKKKHWKIWQNTGKF